MGTVHGVTQLQGSHFLPAAFVHLGAQLSGRHVHTRELFGEFALRQHFHGAADVVFLLGKNHLHAGMIIGSHVPELLGVGAFTLEHQFAFPFLVGFSHLKDVFDLHGGHDFTLAHKSHFLTGLQILGVGGGHIQRHRHGPEGAIGQQHLFAHALPVSLIHEAIQGREAANAHHDEVALGAGRNLDLLQAFGFFLLVFKGFAFQQAADQALTAMRGNQFGHCAILHVVVEQTQAAYAAALMSGDIL